jgi:hypothetical protein
MRLPSERICVNSVTASAVNGAPLICGTFSGDSRFNETATRFCAAADDPSSAIAANTNHLPACKRRAIVISTCALSLEPLSLEH